MDKVQCNPNTTHPGGLKIHFVFNCLKFTHEFILLSMNYIWAKIVCYEWNSKMFFDIQFQSVNFKRKDPADCWDKNQSTPSSPSHHFFLDVGDKFWQ